MRIGIDVGGTNTDAVLMDGNQVVGEYKTPTTPDVTTGITAALNRILDQTGVPTDKIEAVMIGTTHFTNAVVERKRLMEVAAIRLGLPATECLPPMVDWPADLREVIGNHKYLCHGGHEFDGRLISPLDEQEIIEVAQDIKAKGLKSAAISSVFSPVNSEMENRAAEILQEEVPGITISLSHEIGRIGLLERENAAIMNACLRDLANRIVDSFRQALGDMKIDASFFISQNDGTLMSAEFAGQYPVLTFASGPTNSMRGAAFLSGVKDAMVVDLGGTTSDVGMLIHGFPREASVAVEIGGVRTNFRMPDVYSFGLGGGSIVSNHPLKIGPQSVGYELTTQGMVFGGSVMTATDMAVAGDLVDIGDKQVVQSLDSNLVKDVLNEIQSMVDNAVDRMKTSADPIPVILVGGGTILVSRTVEGASEMLKPDHFPVANAVGAAIAQVGGEIDRVFSLEKTSRDEVLDQAKQEASNKAIAAGAKQETVHIVDVEEVPLTYLPSNAVRVRVKAVGDLALS
ncbi:MAG: hydantoinase/oxoprolinase N-terminal domain-containing protein [Candidatus Bipolaricaulia bacterium]